MARWIKAPKGKITENFSWDEAKCRCCGRIPDEGVVEETAEWLERVRLALGGYRVKVLSWCRCPAHNAAVGGADKSLHIQGVAVDIAVKERSPKNVRAILRSVEVGPLIGGMGYYDGFTHIDRGPRRSWRG